MFFNIVFHCIYLCDKLTIHKIPLICFLSVFWHHIIMNLFFIQRKSLTSQMRMTLQPYFICRKYILVSSKYIVLRHNFCQMWTLSMAYHLLCRWMAKLFRADQGPKSLWRKRSGRVRSSMGFFQGSDTSSDRSNKCMCIHFIVCICPCSRFHVFFLVEWSVRGMMYYRETLELQCFLDFADDRG